MNKKEKSALVPRLRFPEFRESGEWEEKTLGDTTYKVGKKNTKGITFPIYSINNKEGFLPQSEQFEGMDSNSRGYDISLYKIIEKNTFAYNPARINIGSLGYSGELNNIIISSLYVCFKTNKIIEDKFLMCFFSTNNFVQAVKNSVEGGIRNYLFYDNFAKIAIQFPKKEEQQKIADCLTSLDDLITAEDKKLDALKAHKKGLMQKLFPAEGETVPEWRFPEFRDSSEWEINELGKESTIVMGASPKSEFYNEENNGLPLLQGNADIKNRVSAPRIFTSQITQECQKDDILMSVRAPVGTIAKSIHHACIGRGIAAIRANKDNLQEFLYQWLFAFESKWRNISQGGTFDAVNSNDIRELKISLPLKLEQQKIADCLSSLDDLITAQSEKINAMKTHKKGLMQGLFPSFEEVGR